MFQIVTCIVTDCWDVPTENVQNPSGHKLYLYKISTIHHTKHKDHLLILFITAFAMFPFDLPG